MQANRLLALAALEMHVPVCVLVGFAGKAAGIFYNSFVVNNLVYNTHIVESLQRPVYGNTVKPIANLSLDIGLRKSHSGVEEYLQYFLANDCVSYFMLR